MKGTLTKATLTTEVKGRLTGSKAALVAAIAQCGGVSALAECLEISSQAISQWECCPGLRVLEVERYSGVSRHDLRPDLYPREQPK